MKYILEGEGIKRDFVDGEKIHKVLKGIDLKIKKGEFVSIVGKSGTGKSTLVYQLSLLDKPTEGRVYLNDKNITNLSNEEKTSIRLNNFGFVFQDYALLPELTALENIILPLIMKGFSKNAAKDKGRRLMDNFGMLEKADKKPSTLSGGEKQRVSILRSVIHDPKVIFADEPTANLDNETSKNVLNLFKELNRSGQTIVMITHELDYAEISDRIIKIDDGRIVSERNISNEQSL